MASCIDLYKPNLKNYKSHLVVEGVISNENASYNINLHRTTNVNGASSEKVNDANVYITDGDGIKTILQNCDDGNYKTDSSAFRGIIGKKYTLNILTSDGEEYRSDECTLLPVASIDSTYYEKGEEISGNLGVSSTGLKIFLNTSLDSGASQYFRWTFNETWKFLIPYPPTYKCLMVLDEETYLFEQIAVVKDICWRENQSTEILINSLSSGLTNFINKQSIQFIDPVKSDRLTQQYSILIKQYSLSEKEFNFWKNLKKAGEAGEDIFGSQPYQVSGNIHNVNDASESVAGFFSVSALSQKRIYITARELDQLYLPHYKTDCREITKGPNDFPARNPPSFWEIYNKIMRPEDYTFIRPIFNPDKTLRLLVYATKYCSLCEFNGITSRPDFWVDLK